MKYRLLLALILSVTLSFALISFAAKEGKKHGAHAATQPATTQAVASGKPINKFCAVEQDNPVDPKVPTVTYKGKVIGFCCEDCAPTFKKNPEKYMKTLK